MTETLDLSYAPGLGAVPIEDGVRFSVWSGSAERIWTCLFDEAGRETDRIELARQDDGIFAAVVAGLAPGARYGFRADGRYCPTEGYWFDPAKLLADPYAMRIDRPYAYDPRLAANRLEAIDTAMLMPKGVVEQAAPRTTPPSPLIRPGGLIYEINIRSFTWLHPDVPEEQRGTLSALAHPALTDHLVRLGVSAVELMPVTAWIDERHLPPLGLANAWGYNPVTFMALDPRLASGGIADLRKAVSALREAGIGVILDLVFNHTGESDIHGPTLSLRGLDARAYYRHRHDGSLVNDTGCGHTVACDHPRVRELVLSSLRYFVQQGGVDGFRFDLAPILGRDAANFDPGAPLLRDIAEDPALAGRVLIAEPWDIGPGGYRLGAFQPPWLEWNDRYRDDVRRFWRGDPVGVGSLATRLAGSSDIFEQAGVDWTRSVNFVAAHDGMTLADLSAYEQKHNLANGEDNRDGHNENLSWNHGVEGETADLAILEARRRDVIALLATLLLSRGTVMLTAGDEFGRSQKGNNNAYAQDNAITWLDWQGRDRAIEAAAIVLSAIRRESGFFDDTAYLSGFGTPAPVTWVKPDGSAMTTDDWENLETSSLGMILAKPGRRLAVLFNASREPLQWDLPAVAGRAWRRRFPDAAGDARAVDPRSVAVYEEIEMAGSNRKRRR